MRFWNQPDQQHHGFYILLQAWNGCMVNSFRTFVAPPALPILDGWHGTDKLSFSHPWLVGQFSCCGDVRSS